MGQFFSAELLELINAVTPESKVNLEVFLCSIKHCGVKTWARVEVLFHGFLKSAQGGVQR